jgi:coenzyme F420 hydrogenase subunit delta
MIAEIFNKPVLVFGCGNILLGDDGFGPAVINHLEENHSLPDTVFAVDAGTSIRDLLFDLILSPCKPERILILDAVSQPDRHPGELFEIDVQGFPENKVNDYSLHQFPSVNLLQELKTLCGIKVKILAVQTKTIPDEIHPGLSPEVEASIADACRWVITQMEEGHD